MTLKHLTTVAALMLSIVAASPAFAQTTTTVQTTTVTGPAYREVDDDRLVIQPFNLTVGRLDDMNVVGPTGENIGEIDEVLMDATGKPVAVTVEVGGFLGIGSREVIIPFEQLQPQGDRFMVNMTRQQIEVLPKWD